MGNLDRRIATAKKRAVDYRNYRRVRDRALRRLSNLYPDQYRELFEEERIRDEQESKVWLDLDGRTRLDLGKTTKYSGSISATKVRDSKSEGNDGGEK